MVIKVRNDRGRIVLRLKIANDEIVGESLEGCYISDIDRDIDNEIIYRLDVAVPENLVEELSNQTLLDEISHRMIL